MLLGEVKARKTNRGGTLWSLFKVCGTIFVGKLKIFRELRLMDIQQVSSRTIFPPRSLTIILKWIGRGSPLTP